MKRLFSWIWRVWGEIHEDTTGVRETLDWRPLFVLVLAVVSLTCQYYFGDRGFFRDLAQRHGWKLGSHAALAGDLWFTGARVLGCLLVPLLAVLVIPRERLRAYGWSAHGLFGFPQLGVLVLVAAAPLAVSLAHTTAHFPWLRHRAVSEFVGWELMAAGQLLALEFLFRGFLLRTLERVIGVHAIWVAAVPYCMIHYNKPWDEASASLIAALLLGAMSLRTRAIWGGLFLHVLAAVAAELLGVRKLSTEILTVLLVGIWWLAHRLRWPELNARLRELDWRPLVVMLVAGASLTLQEYVGDRGFFANLADQHDWTFGRYEDLASFGWWSGWRVIGYLILPMLVVLAMPGERLRDYGWSPRGLLRHLHIYVGLYLLVLPLVVLVAHTKPFQHMYPFYRLSNRSTFDFVSWELMYAAQFVSLEFFFRGFMLIGTRRTFGAHAIWIMVVPYCMIHYGKTFGETIGAIVAGITLGTIALRTRSIWGGIVIHVGVAITMDLLTLHALR